MSDLVEKVFSVIVDSRGCFDGCQSMNPKKCQCSETATAAVNLVLEAAAEKAEYCSTGYSAAAAIRAMKETSK